MVFLLLILDILYSAARMVVVYYCLAFCLLSLETFLLMKAVDIAVVMEIPTLVWTSSVMRMRSVPSKMECVDVTVTQVLKGTV